MSGSARQKRDGDEIGEKNPDSHTSACARDGAGAEAPVQTADPSPRGLKESDFPRLKQLEPNVYAYEELRPSDPGKFKTTVDMIVVTSAGVLVADGQGNLGATQKLVAEIKNLTPLPIKYVVVCSEHDDHTGGNAAFKTAFPDVVFVASPVSQKALAASATPPTEAVSDKRTIRLGDTDIEILNLGRAHTGGDLSVYVPGAQGVVHERDLRSPVVSVPCAWFSQRMAFDHQEESGDRRQMGFRWAWFCGRSRHHEK